jgi:hypothetical protein
MPGGARTVAPACCGAEQNLDLRLRGWPRGRPLRASAVTPAVARKRAPVPGLDTRGKRGHRKITRYLSLDFATFSRTGQPPRHGGRLRPGRDERPAQQRVAGALHVANVGGQRWPDALSQVGGPLDYQAVRLVGGAGGFVVPLSYGRSPMILVLRGWVNLCTGRWGCPWAAHSPGQAGAVERTHRRTAGVADIRVWLGRPG